MANRRLAAVAHGFKHGSKAYVETEAGETKHCELLQRRGDAAQPGRVRGGQLGCAGAVQVLCRCSAAPVCVVTAAPLRHLLPCGCCRCAAAAAPPPTPPPRWLWHG